MAEMRITGAKEIEAILRKLPDKIGRRVLNAALRTGANVIAKEARLRVPVDNGDLRDSITVRQATRGVFKAGRFRRIAVAGHVFVAFKKPF